VTAAVVDAHRERERVVAGGELLGVLQLLDDRSPQARLAAGPPDADAPFVELVAAAVQHVAVVAHEEAHLLGRAGPVLGREGVDAEVLHARLDRAGDDVEEHLLARPVSFDACESPAVRPPAVAVHDDRDVVRHTALREARRMDAGPIEGRYGTASRCV
jgi:hypothetical protein